MVKAGRADSELAMFLVLVCCSGAVTIVYAGNGNAEVTRYRNLQFFEMTPGSVHPAGNASVWRYRNLQFFEMTPGSVHPAGNASVSRYRNLQFFEMTLNQTLSATISSFTTTDQDGNAKSSFSQGSMIVFKATISEDQASIPNALISVMVEDPSQVPIFLSFTYGDIVVGKQETVYLGFRIADDSMLGDFAARIAIFSRFPSQGGQAITFAEVHFDVAS